ncbi:ribosomal protein S18-alanine N-acetyltransferase [Marinomonas sp. IMCC 4694]|uniref:ribosomal protein S18-alanine N-acetyltransferase n=1 Tax=Marinomonas sp. IMCC 4694 TaxID=2605432 RepID=UPI0011E7839F|nr:ribosomal protein S18-alanine N-acetyltransferase [Marinomonas sp. IMCC 4694]TYL46722.1 ribosomal-protein-alanine N-acetyltransferase [Marinomonas sp. IMCC 4694]
MINECFIRQAVESDEPSIIALDALSNPHPWGANLVADALQTRRNWVVVASEVSPNVVGWLTASVVLDQSELELIVIDSAVRRQGLARRLMMAWLASVAQQGVTESLLEVRESNESAMALYESLGFVLVGRRKNYYEVKQNDQTLQGREAACLLTLNLSAERGKI